MIATSDEMANLSLGADDSTLLVLLSLVDLQHARTDSITHARGNKHSSISVNAHVSQRLLQRASGMPRRK